MFHLPISPKLEISFSENYFNLQSLIGHLINTKDTRTAITIEKKGKKSKSCPLRETFGKRPSLSGIEIVLLDKHQRLTIKYF
jgi:hypothetical protein